MTSPTRKATSIPVFVADHDTGRLCGRARHGQGTVHEFAAPGDQRAAVLTHASADGDGWAGLVVAERGLQPVLGADPLRVVSRVTSRPGRGPPHIWRKALPGRTCVSSHVSAVARSR